MSVIGRVYYAVARYRRRFVDVEVWRSTRGGEADRPANELHCRLQRQRVPTSDTIAINERVPPTPTASHFLFRFSPSPPDLIVHLSQDEQARRAPTVVMDFSNHTRNMALHAQGVPLPKATSTGTTIVGCIFDGGVVVSSPCIARILNQLDIRAES